MLIDTHAHLYDSQFDSDREEMLARARHAGISRIFLPNIDLSSVTAMHHLEDNAGGLCVSMMGLHPCSVKEDFEDQLDKLYQWFGKRTYAAVGETGIDLYWDQSTLQWQIEAFVRQIGWGKTQSLPIVIHSRESTREILEVLHRERDQLTGGVFHCFTGTVDQAFEAIDLGFYIGIGGSSTYKNSTVPEVIKRVGLDHLVLETDAPYLAPMPWRGKRNESSYLPVVAGQIAAVKNIDVEEVARLTTRNAMHLFSSYFSGKLNV